MKGRQEYKKLLAKREFNLIYGQAWSKPHFPFSVAWSWQWALDQKQDGQSNLLWAELPYLQGQSHSDSSQQWTHDPVASSYEHFPAQPLDDGALEDRNHLSVSAGEQSVPHSPGDVTYTYYSSCQFREPNREGHIGGHFFIKASCLEDFKGIKINLEKKPNQNPNQTVREENNWFLTQTCMTLP